MFKYLHFMIELIVLTLSLFILSIDFLSLSLYVVSGLLTWRLLIKAPVYFNRLISFLENIIIITNQLLLLLQKSSCRSREFKCVTIIMNSNAAKDLMFSFFFIVLLFQSHQKRSFDSTKNKRKQKQQKISINKPRFEVGTNRKHTHFKIWMLFAIVIFVPFFN